MSRLLARVAGFAITTIALITSIHVGKQGSWGEALDGLGSGAWFTLPFAINSVAMALAGFALPGAARTRETMRGLAEAGDVGDEPHARRTDRG